MAYTRLTAARNGVDSVLYAKCGSAHNGKGNRNDYISVVNLLDDNVVPIEKQMASYFVKGSAQNLTQTRRLIQSFSVNELDPLNQHDIQLANEIGRETAMKLWPEYPSDIFTQTDGAHGLIHNHIIAANINVHNFKGMTSDEANYWLARRVSDTICGKYFVLDRGQKAKDKTSQYARVARRQNQAAKESGTENVYIWTDDLKERIIDAAHSACNFEEFGTELKMRGVGMVLHTPKREASKERHPDGYITYELLSPKRSPRDERPLKARSYKLGADYDVTSLMNLFAYNARYREYATNYKQANQRGTDSIQHDKQRANGSAGIKGKNAGLNDTSQRHATDATASAARKADLGSQQTGRQVAAGQKERIRPQYESKALTVFANEYHGWPSRFFLRF